VLLYDRTFLSGSLGAALGLAPRAGPHGQQAARGTQRRRKLQVSRCT
jgi:hypothetical protein